MSHQIMNVITFFILPLVCQAELPVMFKPCMWKGPNKVTDEDTMKMIEDNFKPHLRNWIQNPQTDQQKETNEKILAQAEKIMKTTMNVKERYMTRPVDTNEFRVIGFSQGEGSNKSVLTLEMTNENVEMDLVESSKIYGGIWFSSETMQNDNPTILDDAKFLPCKVLNSNYSCLTIELDHPELTPFSYDDGNYNIAHKNQKLDETKEKQFVARGKENMPEGAQAEIEKLTPGSRIRISGTPALNQNCSQETQMHVFLCTVMNALVGNSTEYLGSNSPNYHGDFDHAGGDGDYTGIIDEALKTANLRAYDIDMVVVTQHSPGPFPGVAAHLLSLPDYTTPTETMFHPNCKQYFLPASAGCAGGTISMGLVRDLLRANPEQNCLLINIELCSLGFRPKRGQMSWLLNAGLFGDAVAATCFRGSESVKEMMKENPTERFTGLEMVESIQRSVPNTMHVSGFTWDPEGYHFVTTQELCTVVEKNVPNFCTEVAKKSGFNPDQSMGEGPLFIIHPGGAKMVQAVRNTGICQAPCVNAASYSLNFGGNLASCSILKIFDERWNLRGDAGIFYGVNNNDTDNRKNVVTVAMGPGFVMCGVGLRTWVPCESDERSEGQSSRTTKRVEVATQSEPVALFRRSFQPTPAARL